MTEGNIIALDDGLSGPAPGRDPEFGLALRYASPGALPALFALFALDSALAGILRTTREPLVGQMRLTWWHEAFSGDDAERGEGGGDHPRFAFARRPKLAVYLPDAVGAEVAFHHRPMGFLAMAGEIVGASDRDPLVPAGKGWALADLGRHLSERSAAERALHLASLPLAEAGRVRWSRAARPLGALAQIARMNLAVPLDQPLPVGAPRRVARLLFHRLWGR